MNHLRHIFAECARVIVGLTFVLSGLLKAVDPVGTALKVKDYLAPVIPSSWEGMESMSLVISFLLCGGEFILGAFLLVGIYRRLCARLSVVFMLGMTALTLYILVANPVSDCGCFGDALPLTHLQTFLKNLILLPLTIFVLWQARSLRHLYSRRERWVPGLLAVVGIGYFMAENYRHLPYRDFRPYAIGTDLRQAMTDEQLLFQQKLLEGTKYIYRKDGKEQAFSATTLPDSSWTFVEARSGKEVETLKAKYDFSPTDSLGDPVVDRILNNPGITLLLLSPSWTTASQGAIDEIAELYKQSIDLGYSFYGVSASTPEETSRWSYLTGAAYPMLQLDATPIRTIIRSQPGLLVLRDGKIIDKRAPADFPEVEDVSTYLRSLADPARPLLTPSATRTYLLWGWVALLLLGFLRFWARKLHLTVHLRLRKRLHLSKS